MVLHNMFRALAYPFRILRSSRPPISVNARMQFDRYGQPQYQGVRFKAWRSRPRDMFLGFMAAGMMYEIWSHTVIAPLDNLGRELDEALTEEERKQLEEESTTFFPFPLTTQTFQSERYSRLDPELAEYRKITKDKQLQIIKDAELWVADNLKINGTLKPKPSRRWLYCVLQERPPPYYTLSGLEIGGNAPFIRWETFEVEPELAQRLDRVLYPWPAAKAMWDYVRVAFTLGDANEKAGMIATEHMKLPTGTKVTLLQLFAATPEGQKQLQEQREKNRKKAADMAMKIVEEQNNTIEAKMKTSEDGSVSRQPSHTSLIPSFGQNETNDQISQKDFPTTISDWVRKKKEGSWSDEDEKALRQYLLTIPGYQSYVEIAKRFTYASAIFKLTFRRENQPMILPPPRGAVRVAGFLHMTIPNGWVVLDVNMHWDPKTETFDEPSFQAKVLKISSSPPGRPAYPIDTR